MSVRSRWKSGVRVRRGQAVGLVGNSGQLHGAARLRYCDSAAGISVRLGAGDGCTSVMLRTFPPSIA